MPKYNTYPAASTIDDGDILLKDEADGSRTEKMTAAQLAEYVANKLPPIPVVDSDLEVTGAAADAKATGAVKNSVINNSDLFAFAKHQDGTDRSVTFTWNADGTACTVNGTNNSSTQEALRPQLGSYTTMPDGMRAGKSYSVELNTTTTDLSLLFYFYEDGTYKLARRYTGNGMLYIPSNINGVRAFISLAKSATANNDVISDIHIRELDDNCIVVDTVDDIKGSRHPIGAYVRTRGFNTAYDYGEALYQIRASSEFYTVNGISVFKNQDNNFIVRVFDKPFIYLESLNVESASWSDVNTVIVNSGIDDIRADKLNMSETIEISSYNFTFNEITSSAAVALLLYDMQSKKVVGNKISATGRDNATGLKCTTRNRASTNYFRYNYIDIRLIYATGTCVHVKPDQGRGILENEYHFGVLRGVTYSGGTGAKNGLNIEILAVKENGDYVLDDNEKPLYSYEGEDHYWIDLIAVKNSNNNGRGVNIEIQISDQDFSGSDQGVSVFGTITGVTFHHLSVEECNIGIRMRTGERSPRLSCQSECGIKSVSVLNLRVREVSASRNYLDIVGWFRDIYIRPTSKLCLETIKYNPVSGTGVSGIEYVSETDRYKYGIINASDEFVVIDAGVYTNGSFAGADAYKLGEGIGRVLIATRNMMYIRDRIPLRLVVTTTPESYLSTEAPVVPETDAANTYTLRKFFANAYPCSDYFYIADDLSGTESTPNKITLDLREYYFNESATGIKISVPENCECYVRTQYMTTKKVCDSNNSRIMYEFNRYAKRPTNQAGEGVVSEI